MKNRIVKPDALLQRIFPLVRKTRRWSWICFDPPGRWRRAGMRFYGESESWQRMLDVLRCPGVFCKLRAENQQWK